MPEKDNYIYPTTKYGKPVESHVMVCHEFVCQVLRAGLVFEHKFGTSDFNCNEFGLYDLYKLEIFEKTRWDGCVQADPDNVLC